MTIIAKWHHMMSRRFKEYECTVPSHPVSIMDKVIFPSRDFFQKHRFYEQHVEIVYLV